MSERGLTVEQFQRARAVLDSNPEPSPLSLRDQHRLEFDRAFAPIYAKAQPAPGAQARFWQDIAKGPWCPGRSVKLREAVRAILAECEWRRTAAMNYARHMS